VIDWSAAPVFGVREPGQKYTVRPSAYGIVERSGSLALVRTPEGVYLPGGGIEAGETPEEAMVREAFEECGLHVRPGAWRERAVQFAWAQPERKFFEKECVFLDANVERESPSGTEPDHELFWVPPHEAAGALTHEAHGWAVRTWTAWSRP
jgi:8-oxo-dGTP diphosphatase